MAFIDIFYNTTYKYIYIYVYIKYIDTYNILYICNTSIIIYYVVLDNYIPIYLYMIGGRVTKQASAGHQ